MSTALPSFAGPAVLDAQLHITPGFGEQQILAAMDAVGIAGAILDEFWSYDEGRYMPAVPVGDGQWRPTSPYAEAAALRHPDRFCYIQRVERRDPELAGLMAVLASSGCRAVRVLVQDAGERAAWSAGQYDELLRLAQKHALPVCMLGIDSGSMLAEALARFPGLTFVIDHCGWPRSMEGWNGVLALGRHPNAVLKWSHAPRAFCRNLAPETARASLGQELLRAVEAFGPQRVLWASDLTHEESDASWSQLLSVVQDHPGLSAGDREWILSRTARQVFGWHRD